VFQPQEPRRIQLRSADIERSILRACARVYASWVILRATIHTAGVLSETLHDATISTAFILVELTPVLAAPSTVAKLMVAWVSTLVVVWSMTPPIGLMKRGRSPTSNHQHE
jgi:uncharacterized membrane protein YhaH (DUF805 family)